MTETTQPDPPTTEALEAAPIGSLLRDRHGRAVAVKLDASKMPWGEVDTAGDRGVRDWYSHAEVAERAMQRRLTLTTPPPLDAPEGSASNPEDDDLATALQWWTMDHDQRAELLQARTLADLRTLTETLARAHEVAHARAYAAGDVSEQVRRMRQVLAETIAALVPGDLHPKGSATRPSGALPEYLP